METDTLLHAAPAKPGFSAATAIEEVQAHGLAIHARQKIAWGLQKEVRELLIRLSIAWIVLKDCRNIAHTVKVLKALDSVRRKVLGERRVSKMSIVGGKYYWDLYTPGFNSKAFAPFIRGEANRVRPLKGHSNRFTNIFIAMTKKCPLQCEHCFEWAALNKKETLTLHDVKRIVADFQEQGTGQIQLTGGEPLLKVNDIVEIVKTACPGTEFWVLTSGYNLTLENATKLKNAGLTGIVISLDHFDPAQHNRFRGFAKSFEWVRAAVRNAIAVDLVTALSVCVTKSFASESNLLAYAELAKAWGVSFIQVLEARAVGHYQNMDVSPTAPQQTMLEDFYLKMNFDKRFRTYPMVTYHGYHQRRAGCFASGNRNLYVDTDGDAHACPFCQSKRGSVLDGKLDATVKTLLETGCHVFEGAPFGPGADVIINSNH